MITFFTPYTHNIHFIALAHPSQNVHHMLFSLPSYAESSAFLLTTNTGAPGIWCVCMCDTERKRLRVSITEREIWRVESFYMSFSQNRNNEFPVWLLPYLPCRIFPNMFCCNQKGRKYENYKKKITSLQAFKFSDSWFNEFWNPSATKDLQQQQGQCLTQASL